MCIAVTLFGWGKGSSPLLAQSGATGQGGLGYGGERRDHPPRLGLVLLLSSTQRSKVRSAHWSKRKCSHGNWVGR